MSLPSCFPEGPAMYTGDLRRFPRGDLDLERDLERLLLSRRSRSLSLSRLDGSRSRECDLSAKFILKKEKHGAKTQDKINYLKLREQNE